MSHALIDILLYGVLFALGISIVLLFNTPEYQELKEDFSKIKKKAQKECKK